MDQAQASFEKFDGLLMDWGLEVVSGQPCSWFRH